MESWFASAWSHWLSIALVPAASLLGGYLLGKITTFVLERIAARTKTEWDDHLAARLGAPLTLGFSVLLGYLLVPWLVRDQANAAIAIRALRAGLFFAFFWALSRAVDTISTLILCSRWLTTHPATRGLLPLGARLGKVAIWAVAVVAFLSHMGYPVASLLAGLGIGGLAVAMASKTTLENLFGAFSIGADQPFREGDFIKVEDVVGTVETIGLRSTRIRTLDRTLVTIPNSKLAELRTESYTARDRIRLACVLGLVYTTTAEQMRTVLAGLEKVLRQHPKIWPDTVVVRFRALADFALEIEIMAWFQTADWSEFQAIRQEVLLSFMEVVEKSRTNFAYPTRTVHVVNDKSS
jgi:MscS family membrane protein